MHRLSPAFYAPALLTANLAFLQISKLPQMMHCVEVANLHKPRAHPFHHLTPRLETAPPVGLPLEQVAWVQRVRPQLEQATQFTWWGRGPEAEFLHERGALAMDEAAELLLEVRVFGVAGDRVQRGVETLVALVFPDMDWEAGVVSCVIFPLPSCRSLAH